MVADSLAPFSEVEELVLTVRTRDGPSNWHSTPQTLITWWHAGSGTIDNDAFEGLLKRLGPPLGLPMHASNAEVFKLAANLDIPLVNGRLPFVRTMFELVRTRMEHELPPGEIREQLQALIDRNFADQVCYLAALLDEVTPSLHAA